MRQFMQLSQIGMKCNEWLLYAHLQRAIVEKALIIMGFCSLIASILN